MKKLLFLLLLFLSACYLRKDKGIHTQIDPALLANFNYKVGTYWIYKDSLTGDIDSFYVKNNERYSMPDEYSSYERLQITVIDTTISPLATSPGTYWNFASGENAISLDVVDSQIFGGQIEYHPLTDYPFSDTMSIYVGASQTYSSEITKRTLIGVHPSYTVNGKVYTNVAEVVHAADLHTKKYEDVFFIAAEAGIVKMYLNHEFNAHYVRVWELQRYKIIK